MGKTQARIGGELCLALLREIVASQPPGRGIHMTADNLSSHRTRQMLFLPKRLAV